MLFMVNYLADLGVVNDQTYHVDTNACREIFNILVCEGINEFSPSDYHTLNIVRFTWRWKWLCYQIHPESTLGINCWTRLFLMQLTFIIAGQIGEIAG